MYERGNMLSNSIINKNNVQERNNIILYFVGRLVSLFGSEIYSFAVSLYILKLTGKGLTFAISLIITTLPKIVFGTYAGVICDKFDRKRIVIIMDFLSSMIMFGLCMMLMINSSVIVIYFANFLLATSNTFFSVAMTSSVPNIVSEKNIPRINSLNQSINSISSIAAPLVAGAVFVIMDIKFFLIINGISFLISSISERFINFEFSFLSNKSVVKNGIIKSLREGIIYLKCEKTVFLLILFACILNFLLYFGFTVPIPYIINNVFKMPTHLYGILNAAFPFGMLLYSIWYSIKPQKSVYKGFVRGISVVGISYILFGIIASLFSSKLNIYIYFGIFLVLFFSMSIGMIMVNIPLNVMLQKIIPNEIRGRIIGIISSALALSVPFGMFLSGIMIDNIRAQLLPLFSGVLLIVSIAYMSRIKELKEI